VPAARAAADRLGARIVSGPLVEVRDLTKHFPRGGGLFTRGSVVKAVDGVSFAIAEGETFGLVGESGSGKSTTGRCMLRLVEPTSGEVRYQGEDVLAFSSARMRAARRHLQMIFQDPYSSLNPRMRAREIVDEPLVIHKLGTRTERAARVAELFRLVGLDPAHLDRYPHEFSGGQRQRIGVARALALEPKFIIADEPVSALDVSIQAQVINLLMDLQQRLQLTYLFIAHDLRLVRHICRRVAVMYLGRIVEMGDTEAIFANPAHPYTRALLSAIPVTDPDTPRQRIELDPATMNLEAPLSEVEPGHLAAV
jgi:ABC-type oligopeptide transport system ATPase subunit